MKKEKVHTIDGDIKKIYDARFALYIMRKRINELTKGQKYILMESRRNLLRELKKLEVVL